MSGDEALDRKRHHTSQERRPMTIIRAARLRRAFARDNRGGVAIWFGLMLIPLIFCAGTGLDLARSLNQQAQIQAAVDAAALAGASAYTSAATAATALLVSQNYMTTFQTSSGLSLTLTYTPGTVVSGSSVSLYTMKVTASAPIQNTLMSMAKSSNTIFVTATAQNPVYSVTISASSFSASAMDTNVISYYVVPSDGSVPTTTVPMFSNASGATNSSMTIPLTASQQIGFMLTNTTNGQVTSTKTCSYQWTWYGYQNVCTTSSSNGYGNNQYGGTPGSIHYFYSHLYPPSKIAYPSVTQNCSLKVVIGSSTAPATGCTTSLSTGSTLNCNQQSGQTLYYYWNDMGGSTDDKDFNDASYQVTCSKISSGVSKGLVLTN